MHYKGTQFESWPGHWLSWFILVTQKQAVKYVKGHLNPMKVPTNYFSATILMSYSQVPAFGGFIPQGWI